MLVQFQSNRLFSHSLSNSLVRDPTSPFYDYEIKTKSSAKQNNTFSNLDQQSFNRIKKRTEEGDLKSMALLGNELIKGKIITQNISKGMKLLTEAANKGEPTAQNWLGLIFLDDRYVSPNYHKAKYLFEQSAKQGNSSAMKNLSKMYYSGTGVKKNDKIGFSYLKKAVDNKDTFSLPYLGIAYIKGLGVFFDNQEAAKCFKKAIELDTMTPQAYHVYSKCSPDYLITQPYDREMIMKKAAEGGIVDAYQTLSQFYLNINQNKKKALEFCEKGISQGSAACFFWRAIHKMDNNWNQNQTLYPNDFISGYSDLLKASQMGYGEALLKIALKYQDDKNYKLSKKYFMKAIKRGCFKSYLYMALQLESSPFRIFSRLNSKSYLIHAAEHGNIHALSILWYKSKSAKDGKKALFYLNKIKDFIPNRWDIETEIADIYENNNGIFNASQEEERQKKIVEALQKAIDYRKKEYDIDTMDLVQPMHNVGFAEYFLASKYHQGKGVIKDQAKAKNLLKESSKLHYIDANAQLGYFNEKGYGGSANFKSAVQEYKKGILLGSHLALKRLTEMKFKTPDEFKIIKEAFNFKTINRSPICLDVYKALIQLNQKGINGWKKDKEMIKKCKQYVRDINVSMYWEKQQIKNINSSPLDFLNGPSISPFH